MFSCQLDGMIFPLRKNGPDSKILNFASKVEAELIYKGLLCSDADAGHGEKARIPECDRSLSPQVSKKWVFGGTGEDRLGPTQPVATKSIPGQWLAGACLVTLKTKFHRQWEYEFLEEFIIGSKMRAYGIGSKSRSQRWVTTEGPYHRLNKALWIEAEGELISPVVPTGGSCASLLRHSGAWNGISVSPSCTLSRKLCSLLSKRRGKITRMDASKHF